MSKSPFLNKVFAAIPLGEKTTGSDFSVLTNVHDFEAVQRIAFLDSRGKKTLPENDLNFTAALLASYWEKKNEKYLILTRTHASTTFITLLNFLDNLQIPVPYLLTNVGFVDFTPKKKLIIDDILIQAKSLFMKETLKVLELESHQLSSGEVETLLAVDLFEILTNISLQLERLADRIVFIGSHEIPADIRFERARPVSFYLQLKETNRFLKALTQKAPTHRSLFLPVIETPAVPESLFDGVHLTPQAHLSLFKDLVKKQLI